MTLVDVLEIFKDKIICLNYNGVTLFARKENFEISDGQVTCCLSNENKTGFCVVFRDNREFYFDEKFDNYVAKKTNEFDVFISVEERLI